MTRVGQARWTAVAALVAGVAILAACTPANVPSTASLSPGSPSLSAAPRASRAGATVSPASGSVAVDPSLLDVLPEDVEGVGIELDPVTAESVSRDPELIGKVEAIAIGLAVDAESEGANLAIVNVVRLRPGVFNDAFFRNWRDTYDEAACAQAGGVVGNAEAEIGSRAAFIGTCTGGAHTYHVVARDGILVSVTAVGEKRLGERIIEGIRA